MDSRFRGNDGKWVEMWIWSKTAKISSPVGVCNPDPERSCKYQPSSTIVLVSDKSSDRLLDWRLTLEICGEDWVCAHGVSSRAQVPGRACAGAALLSAGASMAQSAAIAASAADSQVLLRNSPLRLPRA